MADNKIETVEPDPAATSLTDDATVNGKEEAVSGETDKLGEQAAEAVGAEKESEDVKDEAPEAKPAEGEEDRRSDRSYNSEEEDKREHRLRRSEAPQISAHSRPNNKRYSANVKTDFESLPESDDHEEIRKQVEFYFSDSNLPQDKFLFEQVEGSKNRSVPIKTIHSFKRMRHFQPYSAVVEALKESKFLEVLEGDEIRRREPLEDMGTKTHYEYVKAFDDKSQSRSIYAKGFGEETGTTQFDIENFFKPYGTVRSVRLRRSKPEKVFKGSVFVEFEDEETQQSFLELDPPKWDGKALKIMSKKEYCDTKIDDINAGRIKANDDRESYRGRGRGGGRGRGRGRGDSRHHKDHRDRDSNDWRGRRDDFQKSGYRDGDDEFGRDKKRRGGGGHRDDRRDNKRKERENDREKETKIDENGIPVVQTSPTKTRDGKANGADVKEEQAPKGDKKRARDDDGADEQALKKTKPETEVVKA